MAQAVQASVFLAAVLNRVPIATAFTQDLLPEWQYLFKPEWETVIFRIFILVAVAVAVFWMRHWQAHKNDIAYFSRLKLFVAAETVVTFFVLSAAFKMTVYASHPQLAEKALGVLGILSILNKLLWPRVEKAIASCARALQSAQLRQLLGMLLTAAMPVLIFLIIYTPDIDAVMARFFFGEQFHHNDSFVFGPSFAFINGCLPDVDIISQYGVGVGVIFGSLSKALGGFSYEHVYVAMMGGVIVYFILAFVFLRRWLASTVLAAAGILYILKIQMFNTGVYPFALTYGSATVLRYWFDMIVFLMLLMHADHGRRRYMLIAGLACGAQLFYIPTDGVYLSAGYAAYLLLHGLKKQWRTAIGLTRKGMGGWLVLLALPVLTLLSLWHMAVGNEMFTAAFKGHLSEFVEYFLSGFGVTPIYGSLQDRQFLASAMGFVIPVLYVVTLLFAGSLLLLNKIHRRNNVVIVICLYGLAQYHYYVARSAETSYYVVAVPFGMLLAWWANVICNRLSPDTGRMVKAVLLLISGWALLTTQNFLAYPNLLNVSHNPITDQAVAQPLRSGEPYLNHLFRDYEPGLKVPLNSLGVPNEGLVKESDFDSDDALVELYKRESDFSIDAALIDRFTAPGDPVALISSFEIKMLMQAKRKPYFYYFPLVISHPLKSRTLVRISIYTTGQLNATLAKLAQDRPPYIFMEKIFLSRPLPQYFYYYYSSMLFLTDYILEHYTPVAAGQYLVALKYKESPKT